MSSMREPSTRLEVIVDGIARWLIAKRKVLSVLFVLITLALGASALRVHLDPGFNKLIPLKHPFMEAFLKHGATFAGANRVLVSVRWKGEGDIYNPEFMKVMRAVTDDVFFTPGVNRAQVFSIFTPNVKYIEVTEEGFAGEVVIPSRFEADAEGLAKVRANVARSGEIGRLVATDLRAALVRADLLEVDPSTGKKLDYADVSHKLEEIRAKYSNDHIDIQIIGFAKVVGDVMEGLFTVITFFGIAFVITAVLLWIYSRSLKLTVLALVVALLPVIWLLGILPLIGYGIDPMSILVPFMIFSIGVSHAVQMTNAWKQDVLAGASAVDAAQIAFRNLAIPGTVALVTNALGFMVIMLIDIPIVHELGVTACMGVLLMIITNKMILPIILSHLSLERQAGMGQQQGGRNRLWWAISAFATPRVALATFAVSLGLLAIGTHYSRNLLTGDVGAGVPELRAESRYNRDNDIVVANYAIGMDVLSVYVETQDMTEACLSWPVMNAVERFDNTMRGVQGVQSVTSVAGIAKVAAGGNNEGNPRWAGLQRSEGALRTGALSCRRQISLPEPASTANTMPLPLAMYSRPSPNAGAPPPRRSTRSTSSASNCQRMRPEPASTALAMPSASTVNTLPSATTGPAMIRDRLLPPAPTSTRQASVKFSAASRCSMACVALPPDCGQSGLRRAGGRVMLSSASLGSARSWSSINRTDLRSPGRGGGAVSPSQVPSPQPTSRPANAPVSSVRRSAGLMSWPGRRCRRSPATTPQPGAAATVLRRPRG